MSDTNTEQPVLILEWDDKLATALWNDGYSDGRRAGFDHGYSHGNSTLSRGWFFFTAMLLFVIGLLMGLGIHWLAFIPA